MQRQTESGTDRDREGERDRDRTSSYRGRSSNGSMAHLNSAPSVVKVLIFLTTVVLLERLCLFARTVL